MESDGTSDECSQELMNTGFVKDILIEAQRASDQQGVKGMYLSTFEGHGDLQCAWVRESGMSKDAKDWWRLESELRYPGYSDADYPCYDDKENSLGHSLSSGEFLRCLPLALRDSPAPEQSFMELVANPGFNAWNFVLALIGETSFELFFRITETLVDSERKILMEEKYPIPETSDIQPEAPVRRLRLIVSSSSSDEEKEVKRKHVVIDT